MNFFRLVGITIYQSSISSAVGKQIMTRKTRSELCAHRHLLNSGNWCCGVGQKPNCLAGKTYLKETTRSKFTNGMGRYIITSCTTTTTKSTHTAMAAAMDIRERLKRCSSVAIMDHGSWNTSLAVRRTYYASILQVNILHNNGCLM